MEIKNNHANTTVLECRTQLKCKSACRSQFYQFYPLMPNVQYTRHTFWWSKCQILGTDDCNYGLPYAPLIQIPVFCMPHQAFNSSTKGFWSITTELTIQTSQSVRYNVPRHPLLEVHLNQVEEIHWWLLSPFQWACLGVLPGFCNQKMLHLIQWNPLKGEAEYVIT